MNTTHMNQISLNFIHHPAAPPARRAGYRAKEHVITGDLLVTRRLQGSKLVADARGRGAGEMWGHKVFLVGAAMGSPD